MPPIPQANPLIVSPLDAPARSESMQDPAPHGLTAHNLIGKERPFRFKLRGSVLMLVQLPNRRTVRGKIHQLSITGGLMNLEQPLEEKLDVELIFNLGDTTIREKAQLLFPMWATQGWLQPFRFIDLPDGRRSNLEKSLLRLVQGSQNSAS